MIVAGIATVSERKDSLADTLETLEPQVDAVYYFPGDEEGDAVKFNALNYCNEGDILLTCDDDLLYPPNYVEVITAGLEQYPGAIVSFHGRVMSPGFESYYRDSSGFPCLGEVPYPADCHTLGTGVMAMRFEDAPDLGWLLSQPKNMADVHIARHARERGLRMVVLPHPAGWIAHSDKVDLDRTIWAREYMRDEVQTELMREALA